jgi:hypothetical protein
MVWTCSGEWKIDKNVSKYTCRFTLRILVQYETLDVIEDTVAVENLSVSAVGLSCNWDPLPELRY